MASSAANRSNTSLATSRGAGVRAVDLVDDDDRLQPDLERLGDHELGLRQRAFGGIDQHQGAVHHVEDALDLAAEIGVAGRIDDIDAAVVPGHRGDLGQDGDAALALEIVGIHRALGDALVVAERARLLQQPVDQRGLAVVDMGDDGDVAKFHRGGVKLWWLNYCGPQQDKWGPRLSANIVSRGRCATFSATLAVLEFTWNRTPLPGAPGSKTTGAVWTERSLALLAAVSNTRRILCVFPAYTPSFGTFSHAYRLMHGVQAFMPPQGLLLIAAYMPEYWPVRFIDENIARATAADFAWADVVLVSGMHIQAPQIRDIARPRQGGRQGHGAGRAVGVERPRNVSGLRLPACRRARRRHRRADRALDETVRAAAAQLRFQTKERLPLERVSDPGL